MKIRHFLINNSLSSNAILEVLSFSGIFHIIAFRKRKTIGLFYQKLKRNRKKNDWFLDWWSKSNITDKWKRTLIKNGSESNTPCNKSDIGWKLFTNKYGWFKNYNLYKVNNRSTYKETKEIKFSYISGGLILTVHQTVSGSFKPKD